ncbi:MAG: hypothetical protein ACI9EW_000751 [Cellvibrionaceae bacterium]|jgi:hypothetical protein
MNRLLQAAAFFIVIGFLIMFAGFFSPAFIDPLFLIGGGFASLGALAAVSASVALMIKLLRE